ncbi:bZIP transcription factor [Pseudohyphozyma bogoriensis]|nr:bZIP transcription factor [Pseudohyphozyma bogoriensis]
MERNWPGYEHLFISPTLPYYASPSASSKPVEVAPWDHQFASQAYSPASSSFLYPPPPSLAPVHAPSHPAKRDLATTTPGDDASAHGGRPAKLARIDDVAAPTFQSTFPNLYSVAGDFPGVQVEHPYPRSSRPASSADHQASVTSSSFDTSVRPDRRNSLVQAPSPTMATSFAPPATSHYADPMVFHNSPYQPFVLPNSPNPSSIASRRGSAQLPLPSATTSPNLVGEDSGVESYRSGYGRNGRSGKEEEESRNSAVEDDAERRKVLLERNRVAAVKSRQKKKEKVATLEHDAHSLCSSLHKSQHAALTLLHEAQQLRSLLALHTTCTCTHVRGYLQREQEGGGLPLIQHLSGSCLDKNYTGVPKMGSTDDVFGWVGMGDEEGEEEEERMVQVKARRGSVADSRPVGAAARRQGMAVPTNISKGTAIPVRVS